MAQKEMGRAVGNYPAPSISKLVNDRIPKPLADAKRYSTKPQTVVGVNATWQCYLQSTIGVCQELLNTTNPGTIEACIRQLESVPSQLRQLRRERVNLARDTAPRGWM